MAGRAVCAGSSGAGRIGSCFGGGGASDAAEPPRGLPTFANNVGEVCNKRCDVVGVWNVVGKNCERRKGCRVSCRDEDAVVRGDLSRVETARYEMVVIACCDCSDGWRILVLFPALMRALLLLSALILTSTLLNQAKVTR